MFKLHLKTEAVPTTTGAVLRVTDLSDWSQAVSVRGTWAIFLSGIQLGSVQAQDTNLVLVPGSYEPHAFQSGDNTAGTVELPLPGDGVFRVQAVAVPLLLSNQELLLAPVGRVYYRLDTQAFVCKVSATSTTPVNSWEDVLAAAATDQTLLDMAAQGYALSDAELQAGMGKLNLRYLEAANRQRTTLQQQYSQLELLVGGATRQLAGYFYADAATSLLAAQRLLGACLPAGAQSLPALTESACGCQ